MVHGGRGFLDIGVCDRQSKTSDASYEWRLANVITSVASSAFCVKSSLGYAAVRAGCSVRFSHADDFFRTLTQARVGNSVDRTFRPFLSPDLLILNDLGLHGPTAQQSADLYELILNRHRAFSFVITSNRAVDEWLSLFDDPILGNSALDRLADASYQIVMGPSYRGSLRTAR